MGGARLRRVPMGDRSVAATGPGRDRELGLRLQDSGFHLGQDDQRRLGLSDRLRLLDEGESRTMLARHAGAPTAPIAFGAPADPRTPWTALTEAGRDPRADRGAGLWPLPGTVRQGAPAG